MTYDFESSKPDLLLNEKQFFIPGSVTKLFSLSTAWHAFGPDHRFTTPVCRQGALAGGTVDGTSSSSRRVTDLVTPNAAISLLRWWQARRTSPGSA